MTHEKKWPEIVHKLLTQQRVASLATVNAKHSPFLSLVPYAIDTEQKCFLMHISDLAAHSANLRLNDEDVSLMVTEAEPEFGSVHDLVRLSMHVHAQFIDKKTTQQTSIVLKLDIASAFPRQLLCLILLISIWCACVLLSCV
ncbi:pyridoxamine 5'-phosphate oxidase family protein [Paenalcaligenes hominis]|uniref:pyridoxamine 5'-phosphate oxidase family protein n=1 Tax=Paenalcaligenes hominis TaxID=643674 RepID=UPI00352600AF